MCKESNWKIRSDQTPSFCHLCLWLVPESITKNHPDVMQLKLICTKHEPFIMHAKCAQWENSLSDLCRSLCYCFSQTNHFPMWNEVWTLQIQSLKLSSRFSWQGHQEHQAHGKHIQVLTPIELIMTTQPPLRLDAPSFYSMPCTWLWLLWI